MSAPDRERRDELASLHALGVLDRRSSRPSWPRSSPTDPAFAADVRALEGDGRGPRRRGAAGRSAGRAAGARARVGRPSSAGAGAVVGGAIAAAGDGHADSPRRSAARRGVRVAGGRRVARRRARPRAVGGAARRIAFASSTRGWSPRRTRSCACSARSARAGGDELLRAQATVLVAPDMLRVELAGQPAAPAASARAYWSRRAAWSSPPRRCRRCPPTRSIRSGSSPISRRRSAPASSASPTLARTAARCASSRPRPTFRRRRSSPSRSSPKAACRSPPARRSSSARPVA